MSFALDQKYVRGEFVPFDEEAQREVDIASTTIEYFQDDEEEESEEG